MAKQEISTKFHFHELEFIPYNHKDHLVSKKILRNVLEFVRNKKKDDSKLISIDRHAEQRNEAPRILFIHSTKFEPQEERIICSIGLLRKNRLPKMKPKGGLTLIPLGELNNAEVAEETRFIVDYSGNLPLLCIEFNSFGPKATDIEYYLRQIARYELRQAKKTNISILMQKSFDKTLREMKNVLKFNIKFSPKNLKSLDADVANQYFSTLKSFGDKMDPSYIKLEASFYNRGRPTSSSEMNFTANDMVSTLMNKFITRPFNIDVFDSFDFVFENGEGLEKTFSLAGDKSQIEVDIPRESFDNSRELYKCIKPKLDDFISNRYTS
ncbi:hypothetical protein [Roseivirga pacifica]|uniref:hypothetical protein n=1 Tax=Roseivirga pacifica TaxID=1267423 RepID=UPI00209494AF|nr:hypothetical protein [Roseivirga pacifica]MCO6357396.1 hypothetical protein [Roseivirga pacifica]MCO6367889.1 hypothetical protein [Roseivirga pacifica]MCO6369629.1 hypothetical protein [Roseivirga pacifica]MCO6373483.1 hypothetical protein [Roseivirga pacifica]MCO6377261.1 hypothetical protein [Roseivirga pacifica]